MKIKVIKAFFDKNTGEPYNTGETYDSTDKKRISELQTNGYLDVSNVKKEAAKDTTGDQAGKDDTAGDKKGEGEKEDTAGKQGEKTSDSADTDK